MFSRQPLSFKSPREQGKPEANPVNMAERNPTRATRLPDGLDEDFLEFKRENDMTSSEALRNLIRDGLIEKRERRQSRLELIREGLPAGIVLSFVVAVLTGVFAIVTAFTGGTAAAILPAVISASGAVLSIALVELAKRLDTRAVETDEVEG